jgi:muramidase (phage lysozyme)
MRPALAIAIGAALLLLLLRARAAPIDPSTGLPDVDLPGAAPDDGGPSDEGYGVDVAPGYPMDNLNAFTYAVRRSEHDARDITSGDAYFAFYGHTPDAPSLFTDVSDHPAITGEKRGVPLPPDWCRRLGYADGQCVSTAAGAYQINRPTWQQFRQADPARGWARLEDFTPDSQDEAARRILEHDGVMPFVLAGNFHEAILRASKRWASLPGSTAGQHARSWEFVAQALTDALNAQG